MCLCMCVCVHMGGREGEREWMRKYANKLTAFTLVSHLRDWVITVSFTLHSLYVILNTVFFKVTWKNAAPFIRRSISALPLMPEMASTSLSPPEGRFLAGKGKGRSSWSFGSQPCLVLFIISNWTQVVWVLVLKNNVFLINGTKGVWNEQGREEGSGPKSCRLVLPTDQGPDLLGCWHPFPSSSTCWASSEP